MKKNKIQENETLSYSKEIDEKHNNNNNNSTGNST